MFFLGISDVINNSVEGFKSSLNLTPKTVVGIDMGLSSIKFVEIVKHGKKLKINKFYTIPLPEGALIDDEIQKPDEILTALKLGLKKSGIKNTQACIGLSGPGTVTRKLQLAGGDEEDIENQVIWEAEQYLPFDIDDSTVSFHIIGENKGGGIDVVIAAAKNEVIENFKGIFLEAGLKVKIVDLDMIALTNVFEEIMKDKIQDPHNSWAAIDFGAQKTLFVIYRDGRIVFTKEISQGGIMITEEIQRQMGVNYTEAEDLKTTTDKNGNLPEEIMSVIEEILEEFFDEIKKVIDFYVTSTSDESLVGAVLTGGGALTPGVLEGLERVMGVPVSYLNPFGVFEKDRSIKEDIAQEIAFRGIVALGLGMRSLR
jgi:type IV pilus assembly protein PilM